MKMNEMETICKQNNGKCANCPLNCIYNWEEKLTTWCLKESRKETIRRYHKAKIEHNDILALKIEKDYQEAERTYLKL